MRRLLLSLAACAAPAAVFAIAACSSSSNHGVASQPDADATAAPDGTTGGDGGGGEDAADELVVGNVCGPAPRVTLGIVVVALSIDDPDGAALPGAQFTSPLCPGLVQYSNDAGVIVGQVSQDVAFYGALQASGFIPELVPEEIFDASSTGHKIEMLPQLLENILLPGFDASSQTAIIVAAEKTVDDAGACSDLDGVTFTVPGHPEAQVTYFSADTIPQPVPEGGATTTRGLAAITGLAAGGFVTLAATKQGCTVLFQYQTFTGRVPLQNGFVSLTPAYVTP